MVVIVVVVACGMAISLVLSQAHHGQSQTTIRDNQLADARHRETEGQVLVATAGSFVVYANPSDHAMPFGIGKLQEATQPQKGPKGFSPRMLLFRNTSISRPKRLEVRGSF